MNSSSRNDQARRADHVTPFFQAFNPRAGCRAAVVACADRSGRIRVDGRALRDSSRIGAAPRLVVPTRGGEGTPLRVAVDRVVIRRVGQHIEGVLVDPVFAHDRIVIPTGTPERPPRQRSRGIIPSSCAKALSSTRGCSPRSILARWRRRRARRSARRRRRRASSRPGSSRRLTPHTRPEEHRSKRWSRVRCSPRPTKLILPAGARLTGKVTFVKQARYFRRNGQLRFLFDSVHVPGLESETLLASLYSAAAGRADRLAVDEERDEGHKLADQVHCARRRRSRAGRSLARSPRLRHRWRGTRNGVR